MPQFNMNIAPAFEMILKEFVRVRKLKSRAEAIRLAIKEGLDRAQGAHKVTDFHSWIGLGNETPTNGQPRFRSEDELWEPQGS